MKYFIYILLVLSTALFFLNIFQLDYNDIFSSENTGALVGILASACVIVLMLILSTSRSIQKKAKENNSDS